MGKTWIEVSSAALAIMASLATSNPQPASTNESSMNDSAFADAIAQLNSEKEPDAGGSKPCIGVRIQSANDQV